MDVDRNQVELYIGDLDETVTEEILYASCVPFGRIKSIKIMKNIITYKSRGFGFISFTKHEDAKKAMLELNGKKILNKTIRVLWKQDNMTFNKNANVLISNLDNSVKQEDLNELCCNYGTILSSKIVVNEFDSTTSRAYVQYDSEEQAENCVQALNNLKFFDRILTACINSKQNKVAVIRGQLEKNLDGDVAEKLKEKAAEVGRIINFSMDIHKESNSFIAFVEYDNRNCVKNLVNYLNGKFLFENSQLVQVDYFKESDITIKKEVEKSYELKISVAPLTPETTDMMIMQHYNDAKGVEKVSLYQCRDPNYAGYLQVDIYFKSPLDISNSVQELISGQSPLER